jgi:ATP-dependent Zn protease
LPDSALARVRHSASRRAEKLSPCIIFIDEIDALGRQRGRGGDSATADQDRRSNQLLVEMDGFDSVERSVVIRLQPTVLTFSKGAHASTVDSIVRSQ